MINLLWSGVVMALLLSGCGWNGTPTRKNNFIPLTSIEIVAASPVIAAGTSTRLTAKGNYSGFFSADVTDQVVWSSDTPTVAGFTTAVLPNRVSGITAGVTILTATVGSVSSTCVLSVSSATVSKLTITPVGPSIAKGRSIQCTAMGTLSDLKNQDLTDDVTWSSSATGVATVSDAVGSKGLVKTLAVGTAAITAAFTLNGVSDSTLLTVTDPVLQSMVLSQVNPSILTLTTKKFTATGSYSDGTTADISSQVAWSSSNTGIATIAGDGTATAVTQGTSTISATMGEISVQTNLKVTGGNLAGITIFPATQTLVKDTAGRITVTGTFSNGSTRDITGAVTWSMADASLAKVSTLGGNLAWLIPLAATPTTKVTATSGSLSATTNLTVITPALSAIVIAPPVLDLTAGTSSPLTVTATFDNGTTQDVTTLSAWISGDAATATVGTSGLAAGRVTGVTAGSTTISATYGGKTAPTPAAVTVRARTLQSLTVSGTSLLTAGNQVKFTATAGYSDGTSKDVTEDTAWTLDSLNVAILADGLNQRGQVVAVDSGSALLTAGFGTMTKTVTVTVTAP